MIVEWEEGIGHLLDLVIQKRNNKQQDYLFLVSGTEGTGKSFTVLKCIEHIEAIDNITVPIDNIAGSLEEFALAVHHKEDKQVFVLDEGKELEAANWQSKEVKAFKKWITKNRIRSHIYFVCFPNPLSMLPYVRNDKLVAVLLMRKPGLCYAYSSRVFARIVDHINQKRVRDVFNTSPNFICRVPEYKGCLLDDYKVKKRKWTLASDDDFLDDLGVNKVATLLKPGQVAKLLGCSNKSVTRYVESGKLKFVQKTINGVMLFDKDYIINIKKELENNG